MVTAVEAVTALVLTVNVALVAPATTVTLEGTRAAPLLLESATVAPPAGAAPLNVTVPVEEFPQQRWWDSAQRSESGWRRSRRRDRE